MDRNNACKLIARHLTPGTVIVSYPQHSIWDYLNPTKWPLLIAQGQIQVYQKDYFGSQADYRPTHVRIYLGEFYGHYPLFDPKQEDVFEFTTPAAQFTSIWDICDGDIAIMRPTFPLLIDDVMFMRTEAEEMKGLEYDYGDLLDFWLNQKFGYPAETLRIFGDKKSERWVCSTVVAMLYASLRKHIEEQGETRIPRLFDIVDLGFWRKRGVIDNIEKLLPETTGRVRTPVERVTPAHYVNTRYFRREFDTVARFKKGKPV